MSRKDMRTKEMSSNVDSTGDALRRLAGLLAEKTPSHEIFTAVVGEVLRLAEVDTAQLFRLDRDGSPILLADAAHASDCVGTPGTEKCCAITIPLRIEGAIWGMIVLGSSGDSDPQWLERRMTDVAELLLPAIATADARTQLAAVRTRLISASDDFRRDIELRVRTGAQQRVVNLALGLRGTTDSSIDRAGAPMILEQLEGLYDELQDIARTVHPRALSIGGLRNALSMLARRSAVPVNLQVRVRGRLPDSIETAVYRVVAEVLTYTADHARASLIEVAVEIDGRVLRVRMYGDGVGGVRVGGESGLLQLQDRVQALGGEFDLVNPVGGGTMVRCDLPLGGGRH